MKSIRILAVVVFVVMALTMAVSAVEVTPSVETSSAPQAEDVKGPDGKTYSALLYDDLGRAVGGINRIYISVTAYQTYKANSTLAASEEGQAVLEAVEELENEGFVTVVEGFEEAWAEATDGAPVENATIAQIFDLSINTETNGQKVVIELSDLNVKPRDSFIILHKVNGDHYEIVPYTWDGDKLVIAIYSGSPFILVKDNGAIPEIPSDGGEDAETPVESPKTGVNGMSAVVCAVLCAGIAAACVVKAKKEF